MELNDPHELRWAAERRDCYLRLRKAVENFRLMQAAKAAGDPAAHAARKAAVARYLSELKRRHGHEFAERQLRLVRELVATWGPRQHWRT